MVFVQNCWLTIWGSVFVVILVNQRQIFRSGDFDPAMARQTQLGVISQPFKDGNWRDGNCPSDSMGMTISISTARAAWAASLGS